MWLIGLLILGAMVQTAFAATASARKKILDLACQGEIEKSFEILSLLRRSDMKGDAAMLHTQSAFEYILNADSAKAIRLHKSGKSADGKMIPPLGQFYINGESCTGLSDIFYFTAITIKRLVDSSLAADVQVEGHTTMITLLSDTGLSHASEKHLAAALAIKPTDPALLFHSTLMTPVVYDSQEHVLATRKLLVSRLKNLTNLDNLVLPALDEFSLPPSFYLVYQGFDDKTFLEELYWNYNRAYKALDDSAEVSFDAQRTGPIRVGFVSSHLRRHSICKLFCGLFEHLASNKTDSDFQIFIFSTAPETKEDQYTESLSKLSAVVTTVGPGATIQRTVHNQKSSEGDFPFVEFIRMEKSVISNRKIVRSKSLDVLVYLDIGMDPANLMWASTRLAPMQLVTWGHPSTTGLPHIDYFISSELFYRMSNPQIESVISQDFVVSSSDAYTEQLILFSSLSMFFNRPVLSIEEVPISLDQNELLVERPLSFYKSLLKTHKQNLHLSKLLKDKIESISRGATTRFVLCPQQLPKFHPNFDEIIRKILESYPDSIFVVIHDPQSKYQWQRTLKLRWMNTIDKLDAQHLDNKPFLTDRIMWLGRLDPQEYLAVVATGDLMVDPYPFGGGVTTMEALAVCTPVITLPLQTVPALTAGILTELLSSLHVNGPGLDGLDGTEALEMLIADSEDDLVAKATEILNSSSTVVRIRRTLCNRSERIFEQQSSYNEWSEILKRIGFSSRPSL